MRRNPGLARRFVNRFEPVHQVTYFAPEARAALDELGYRGFWMGYFAARAAPLGMVPREVVTAVFYNFAPERVAKALPAARQAPVDGRPLFAANLALPWPDDPLGALWHATTLLREHRGDGHVAVLGAAGISGRECNVFQAAAGAIARDYIARTRDYDEAEWRHHEQQLAERGLLNDDGSITEDGRQFRDDIETKTDALALSALDALSDDEVETLFQALTPITRAVAAAGDVPAVTPMNLSRDELHDGRAHLT